MVALAFAATPAAQASSQAKAALSGCNLTPNPVQCENAQPGSPQSAWLTNEPGDPTIQGFGTDTSVTIGQTISFKVSTPASSWHLDIVRVGWYGGTGGRIVATIPHLSPTTQPSCLVDTTNTTGLVDCGNWSVSASWTVPSSAVSGIYFAHLVRDDTGGDSLIQFVVRNDASQSAILYQTSDVTREAYNRYGGNSLYVCTVACPPGNPLLYKGAYKVSFNRPNQAAALGSYYSFFDAEFPMVEFLEQNGYDTSYISGVDTDRLGASNIEQHKVFMDSGHDEYWSAGQRANVTAARNAGVDLAFFSGNEVFWKTRYEPSTDGTSTSYRTLVSYKETHFNTPTDPQDPGTWTGTWRDTRFSPPADAAPENSLTGQLYMVDPPSPYAISVPGTYAGLRLWRNTAVAKLAPSQSVTLAPNTLGYEWDADVDNGSRPAGEIDMSSTTETNLTNVVQDYYGNAEGPGSATHHLTLYRASSGALVFAAGTVQWAYGLESTGNATVNATQQQATVNLLADMGVQPATLATGLVASPASSDTTPPTATVTSPAPGAVANGSTVTVSGTATDTGGGVVAGVEVSTDGGSTWHPATIAGATTTTTWSYSWTVTGNGATAIEARATDDSANTGAPSAPVADNVTCPCQIFSSASTPKLVDSGDPNAAELGVKFTTTTSGYVTGIRFFKATANTGVHVGDLWSSTGQLLATATFASESASGWQQVTFSQSVPVTAGTVYVASYHTTSGHYSSDTQAFSGRTVSSPPLTALESSTDTSATVNVSGPNGVYAYSTNPAFPSSSFQDSNYWVDVSFVPSSGAPVVVGQSPAASSTGQAINAPVSASFSEAVTPSSIAFTLTGPGGVTVPTTASYNAATQTASWMPQAQLATGATYTATVSGATDSQGRSLAGPVTWSFTTFACPCGLFSATATPGTVAANDSGSVELGVQFTPNINGFVSGVRFYKAATNTGTHVGSLWTTGGQLLAQVTFSGETASGWQTANFSSPIPVVQGTSYIVSYHAPVGQYSADGAYFGAAGLTNGPLQAAGGSVNGLYTYSSGPAFPSQTFNATNYWVDPVFTVSGNGSAGPPTVVSTTPAAGATGVAPTATAAAALSEPVQASSLTMTLTGPGGASVAGTVSYNAASQSAVFTPSAPLAAGVAYTATLTSATDFSGQSLATPYSWAFTTLGVTCPCTLWPSSALPAVAAANDSTAAELGTRFTADRSGYVTGVRFYKGATNTGTHVGDLWSATGTLLATGVFANETGSGWQELDFPNSVPITAGTVYVVSYHTNVGNYAFTSNYFPVGYDNSPLHAPANAGVFVTGGTGFPTQSYQSANYWVDVVFSTTAQPPVRTTPPALAATTPASGATGVAVTAAVTATFDEPVNPSSVTLTVTRSGGGAVTGSTAYNALTRTVTFTPSSSLVNSASYTAAASATDLAGNADPAPLTWSFTAVAPTCPCTVFAPTATPALVDAGASSPLELGMKFQPTISGWVTGVRFYKSAANTGTHLGDLWTSTGQLLASATFSAESASGWQDVAFASPVAVTAGTTYVASYRTGVGHYSYTGAYFATAGAGSGPLVAPASAAVGGNGVYAYAGASSTYPGSSYNSSNYWVDAVFTTSAPGTAPTAIAVSPASNATGVARASRVVATLNESVLPSSLASFALTDSSNRPVAGTVVYDPVTLTDSFIPTAPLSPFMRYSVTITGLRDLSGDAQGPSVQWSFTTGAT